MRSCASSRPGILADRSGATARAATRAATLAALTAALCVAAWLPGAPASAAPATASAAATPSAAATASAATPASAATASGGAAGNADTSIGQKPLNAVIVQAPEPRYVAPTRRDRIGRIWAPVYINGRGPFRLVLDSGATTSGITLRVAKILGLAPDTTHQVLLRGVVGMVPVPIVRASTFSVGDIDFGATRLPIITDALGGADGILGTDRMADDRILIDFHHDLITLSRSRSQRAPLGYVTIPFKMVRHELLVTDAWVGGVRAQAIIDTGGQATIANLAMRNALESARRQRKDRPEKIEDVTDSIQPGNSSDAPPIYLGTSFKGSTIKISNDRLTYGDMHIFEHWRMTREPAMLIGMETLGRLDILVIDYRLHQLQLLLDDSD